VKHLLTLSDKVAAVQAGEFQRYTAPCWQTRFQHYISVF